MKKTAFEDFAAELWGVMRAEGVTVETLLKKPPYGFWSKVGAATGQTNNAARTYWTLHKENLIAVFTEASAPKTTIDKIDTVVTPETTDTVARAEEPPTIDKAVTVDAVPEERMVDNGDQLTREEVTRMMQNLETRLTTLIGDRLATVVIVEGAAAFAEGERPPKPRKEGKKFVGEKEDLRARIDKALFDLLERDCKAYFNGNMSATLDAVLWQFYGKPPLSFQEQDEIEV